MHPEAEIVQTMPDGSRVVDGTNFIVNGCLFPRTEPGPFEFWVRGENGGVRFPNDTSTSAPKSSAAK